MLSPFKAVLIKIFLTNRDYMEGLLNSVLNKYLYDDQSYIFGFADLKGLLKDQYNAYGYGISIGKKLDDSIIDEIVSGPTIQYYNHYKAINDELFQVTSEIHSELNKLGINSLILPPTMSMESSASAKYKEHLTVDISHKMVATRAGLGWIGRTDLFVSHKFGPRIRLTSILIDSEPPYLKEPVVDNECGSCSLCAEYCPANAATGDGWSVKMQREDFFDAFKCRDMCKKQSGNINVNSLICGVCVSICPIGQRIYINK
jgi:epoxyqueuosine reductase